MQPSGQLPVTGQWPAMHPEGHQGSYMFGPNCMGNDSRNMGPGPAAMRPGPAMRAPPVFPGGPSAQFIGGPLGMPLGVPLVAPVAPAVPAPQFPVEVPAPSAPAEVAPQPSPKKSAPSIGSATTNLTRQQAYSVVEVFTALDASRTSRIHKAGLLQLIKECPEWNVLTNLDMIIDAVAPSEALTMAEFSAFCDMVAAECTPGQFNAALSALESPLLVPPGFPSALTPSQEQSVIDLFKVIDADGNGYIEKQELIQHYGQQLAPKVFDAWNLKASDQVINIFEMCKFFDELAGQVSRNEFRQLVAKLELGQA